MHAPSVQLSRRKEAAHHVLVARNDGKCLCRFALCFARLKPSPIRPLLNLQSHQEQIPRPGFPNEAIRTKPIFPELDGLTQPRTINCSGPWSISGSASIVLMAPAHNASSRATPSWSIYLPCNAANRASGPFGAAGSVTNQPLGAVGILTGNPLCISLDHAGHSEFSDARPICAGEH